MRPATERLLVEVGVGLGSVLIDGALAAIARRAAPPPPASPLGLPPSVQAELARIAREIAATDFHDGPVWPGK